MKDLKIIHAVWRRDCLTFAREKGRILSMIGQPLLYLLVLGKGITGTMSLNHASHVEYVKFMYPGIIGMSLLFTSLFSAVSIIWDREFGLLKEVLVAPVSRWAVAFGKCCSGATIATGQSAILILMAPIAGIAVSIQVFVLLILLSFLISFAVTGVGVALASSASSIQTFQMISNFCLMPIFFLSGAMFPMGSAPLWIQSLMFVNPLTYGVDGLRNILFSSTVTTGANGEPSLLLNTAREAGLVRWTLSMDVTVVLVVGAVLAALGTLAFSRTKVR